VMFERRFRVLLKGRRVRLRVEGSEEPALFGWYATRLVWASDEPGASRAAVARVGRDLKDRCTHSEERSKDDDQVPEIVAVTEVSRFQFADVKGFTFFPEPVDS
jgi:hypothetical protein